MIGARRSAQHPTAPRFTAACGSECTGARRRLYFTTTRADRDCASVFLSLPRNVAVTR
jgi:hypothetical protein